MEAFNNDGVIPDVVDKAPTEPLQVNYGDLEITPGLVVTPTQVKDMPTVTWNADPSSFYTLIMDDPDAPSRKDPKAGEWNHWLVTNIPGNDIAKGDTMSEYIGAGPPPNTGLHRYVFLVFKQASGQQDFEGLNKLSNKSPEGRAHWKVKEFAKKYNLGDPLAGNFFQAEYDSYVPKLYAQLGL